MVRTLCTDQEKTGPCASRPPGSASTRDRGAIRWAIRPARTEHNTDVSNPRHWAPRPYPSFVTTVPCRPYPRHEWRRRPRAGDGRVSPTATHAGARRRASVAGWPRDARGGPAVTARCRSRGPLAEGRGGGTRPPLEARLYAPARPPDPRFRPIPARSGGGAGSLPRECPPSRPPQPRARLAACRQRRVTCARRPRQRRRVLLKGDLCRARRGWRRLWDLVNRPRGRRLGRPGCRDHPNWVTERRHARGRVG